MNDMIDLRFQKDSILRLPDISFGKNAEVRSIQVGFGTKLNFSTLSAIKSRNDSKKLENVVMHLLIE